MAGPTASAGATEGATVGLADCTQLLKSSDADIVENLRLRYQADEIHTFVGSMLVVLNPYRPMPIYDAPDAFRGTRLARATPHVFAMAEEAYLCRLRDGGSHSIVISGESGAGKTETTKMLVRYIAQRAGKADAQAGLLPDALVRSNPSLEAFGNAQTTRNSNSSRFAKFTKLHIGADGALLSAHVATYLLEKSRVTQHGVGERNFHIFELMLDAADKDAGGWGAQLRIPKGARAADFTYLRAARDTGARTSRAQPARTAAHGPADLASTIAILGSAGVLEEDARAVVRVAAVALHLGQAEWAPGPDGDGAQLARPGALGAAQELVGISNLEPLLLERELAVPGASKLLIKLTPQQASGARDSLARGLYELAFLWLVAAINAGLGRAGAGGAGGAGASSPFVGLLDVFGFEDFEHNSFEQLCINYANERLQQLLVERLFRQEAKLYADEGVPHPSGGASSFADNLGCVLLLSGKPSGVFRLLDSACITPQASDAKFIASVNATHAGNPFLAAPGGKGSRAVEERFVVKHYAATVSYRGFGFLQKNADALDASCTQALAASTDPFIRSLLASAMGGASGAAGAGADGGRAPGKRGGIAGRSGGMHSSLGRAFIAELDALLETLNSGGCHFVRCVAPSGSGGKAGASLRAFDAGAVRGQLRADGTLDAVRLLQKGYPVRIPYEQLQRRFLPLLAPVSPKMSALSAEQFAELLAAVVGVPGADCALGSSRVFLRGSAAILFDELGQMEPARVLPILTRLLAEWELKRAALRRLAPLILGWKARFRYKRCRRAALNIQARHRGSMGRARAQVRSRERQAEILAQRRAGTAPPAARPALDARQMRESLAVGREGARATLAERDFSMLENEMRVMVARAQADEAAIELAQTPRATRRDPPPAEYIPRQQVVLRAPQSASAAADGSLELLVLEEGTSLPVHRALLNRNELSRLRGIFDEWDLDHDGVVSLGEFFVVMKVLSSKASRGRMMEAAQVEGMFEVADVDRNGLISFAEFALFSYGELTRTEGARHSTLMLHTKAASKLINSGMGTGDTSPGSRRTPLAAMLPALAGAQAPGSSQSAPVTPPNESVAPRGASPPVRAVSRLDLSGLDGNANRRSSPKPAVRHPPATSAPVAPARPSSTGAGTDAETSPRRRQRAHSISNLAAGVRSASGKAISGLVSRMPFARRKGSARTSGASDTATSESPPQGLRSTTTAAAIDSDYEA